MTKGLKCLEEFRNHYFFELDEESNLNVIEKELKAFEIIKNKRVLVGRLIFSQDLLGYNSYVSFDMELTDSEYRLLIEVLHEE